MSNNTFQQEKLKDFTIIRNAIFKDYSLSAKAKGVACQLLSLPPTWEYSVVGLTTLFSDGESSIRSALSELEEAGYLRRERVRDGGKLGKAKYIITDTLNREKPNVENPRVVNPRVGNHGQLNTKESTTKESTTKESYISEFESLWILYPKRQGKKKACDSYVKARKNGSSYEDVRKGIEDYIAYIKAKGTDMQYVKMGSSFFNQKAWEDDWSAPRQSSGNPFMDMLEEGDY